MAEDSEDMAHWKRKEGSDMNTLVKRLLYSAILISVCIISIFKTPMYFFVIINVIVLVFALYEFYTITENKGFRPNKILGLILGATFPLFLYFPGEALVFGIAILILSLINMNEQVSQEGVANTAVTLFGLLYVGLLCSFFSKIIFMPNGQVWVVYVIAVTKMGDAGAYFIGTSFGKWRPLVHISPKKSVEGALAGLVFSFGTSLLFKLFLSHVPFMHFVILGILLSIIGQMGDLTESLIKRSCNVKDSGFIPGLGGILDVLDSLFFTCPFLFYYLSILQ